MVDQIENTVSSSAKSVIDVTTDVTNSCTFKTKNTQLFVVDGGKSVNCKASGTFNSFTSLDTTCITSTETQNDMKNQVAQTAQQQAELIAQQFKLGNTSASNIADLYAELATTVTNTYYNSCINEITNNQTAIIKCAESTNLVADANFNQTTNASAQCIFSNKSVNDIIADIDQEVRQTAKIEVKNFYAEILGAIFGIIIMAGIIIFGILILLYFISRSKKSPAPATQPDQPPFSPAPSYASLPPPSSMPPVSVSQFPPYSPPPTYSSPVETFDSPAPLASSTSSSFYSPSASSTSSSYSQPAPVSSSSPSFSSQLTSMWTTPQNGGPSIAQQLGTDLGQKGSRLALRAADQLSERGSQLASKAADQLTDQALKALSQRFLS